MTIYTKPDLFEDMTPSPGARFGSAIGSGTSDFMKMLAERKMQSLQVNQEYQKTLQKSRGDLPGAIAKFAKDFGRSETFDSVSYDAIYEESEKLLEQGYSANEAARLGTMAYEESKKIEAEEAAQAKAEEGSWIQRQVKKNQANAVLWEEKYGDTHREKQKKAVDKFKSLNPFEFKETEASIGLHERAAEKSKTAQSLDEFTQGELLSLKPDDIKNLPEQAQKDFWEISPSLVKRSESIAKTAGIPFIGGMVEERLRENIDPDLAPPPSAATLSRLAIEFPLLGGLLGGAGKAAEAGLSLAKGGRALGTAGKLGAQAIGGAAVFGGDALANEAIRTLGTDKPFELKQAAVQGAIGAIFPYAGAALKGISKPFRNAIARRIQKTGITGLQATEEVLEKAVGKGISIEKLQAGNKLEGERFSKFLEKDSSETAKKVRKLPVERAETAVQAEKRFAEKSKELEKTSLGKYLEKKKDTPIIKKRRAELEPDRLANEAKITRLKKERKLSTVTSEREAIIKSLDKSLENRYAIEFEIKYGHKPLVSVAEDKAAKSAINLIGEVFEPTEKGLKDIIKNDKTMTTFFNRAKEELASGKFKGDVPDKYFKDFFIKTHEAHLKTYSNLKEDIIKQLKDPDSYISEIGKGKQILDKLEHRILDTKNRLDVQIQKRKVLEQVKGPMGSFYKNWVDKLKGEQKLFTKDMISISHSMNPKEQAITSTALKGMGKAERVALHKDSKLAKLSKSMGEAREAKALRKQAPKEATMLEDIKGMTSEEREAVREGRRIANKPEVKAIEKRAGKAAVKSGKDLLNVARDAGFTEKEAVEKVSLIRRFGRYMTSSKSFEEGRKGRAAAINKLLTIPINQMGAGFVLGSLTKLYEQATDEKIPMWLKGSIYGGVGLTGKFGGRKPWLALTMGLTNWGENKLKVKLAKNRYRASTPGKDRREVYEKIKKKRFSAKELKEIRS